MPVVKSAYSLESSESAFLPVRSFAQHNRKIGDFGAEFDWKSPLQNSRLGRGVAKRCCTGLEWQDFILSFVESRDRSVHFFGVKEVFTYSRRNRVVLLLADLICSTELPSGVSWKSTWLGAVITRVK